MAKTLKDFLEGYLKVKSADEQKFIDKHVTAKNPDRNGNGDDVFKGSTKAIDRRKERKGYNPGEDEKVYEAVCAYDKDDKIVGRYKDMQTAKKLKPGHRYVKEELKGGQKNLDKNHNGKLDSQDFKMLRSKKKVAEEAEQIDESAKIAAHLIKRYGDNVRKSHVMSAAKDFGVDPSKLAKMVRTKLGKTTLGEEQIDEVSAATKDSYAQKAGKQLSDLFKKSGKSADDARKYYNRKNTVRKIANEEVEELDELSNKTLSNYITKGSRNLTGHAVDAGHEYEKGNEPKRQWRKIDNREKGIATAAKKLANEEVEEIDEKLSAKSPMGTYIKDFEKSDAPQFKGKSPAKRRVMAIAAKLTAERGGKPLNKEERLQARLGDISESHQRVMLEVFEKLNEDNKSKFLQACDTPDGVDQMLDFAINNRGE